MNKFLLNIDLICRLCNQGECPFAVEVWRYISNCPAPTISSEYLDWLNSFTTAPAKKLNHLSKAILVCRQILEARNNLIMLIL